MWTYLIIIRYIIYYNPKLCNPEQHTIISAILTYKCELHSRSHSLTDWFIHSLILISFPPWDLNFIIPVPFRVKMCHKKGFSNWDATEKNYNGSLLLPWLELICMLRYYDTAIEYIVVTTQIYVMTQIYENFKLQ